MKAIQVKFFGPTNTRGARLKAFAEGGNSVTIPYPYGLNRNEGHAQAALALCAKLGWKGRLISGGLPNGDEVFVFAESDAFDIPTNADDDNEAAEVSS